MKDNYIIHFAKHKKYCCSEIPYNKVGVYTITFLISKLLNRSKNHLAENYECYESVK